MVCIESTTSIRENIAGKGHQLKTPGGEKKNTAKKVNPKT